MLVVYGKDGMDEVSLGAATMVGELKDGEVREYEIHPEDFGLRMISNRGLKVADALESKTMVLEALDNAAGTPREIVVLNAGAALYAAIVDCDFLSVTRWSRNGHEKSSRGVIRQHDIIVKVLLSGTVQHPPTLPRTAKGRLGVKGSPVQIRPARPRKEQVRAGQASGLRTLVGRVCQSRGSTGSLSRAKTPKTH